MRATRGNRTPAWTAWLAVSGLVGLAVGPLVAVVAMGSCAVVLGAEEFGYRRRARRHFADLHRRTRRRHDEVLDRWMTLRDETDRPSSRLADDVRRKPTARFITVAAVAADRRSLARSSDYASVAAYDEAVADLEQAWRMLALQGRGLDAWQDAQRWGRTQLRAAWRAAEARFASRTS